MNIRRCTIFITLPALSLFNKWRLCMNRGYRKGSNSDEESSRCRGIVTRLLALRKLTLCYNHDHQIVFLITATCCWFLLVVPTVLATWNRCSIEEKVEPSLSTRWTTTRSLSTVACAFYILSFSSIAVATTSLNILLTAYSLIFLAGEGCWWG